MSYSVTSSFDEFIDAISIDEDFTGIADKRRNRILELLEDEFTILDAFPMGSLVRGTGLLGHADIDVLVALHFSRHIRGKSPLRVVEDVRDHLSIYNSKLVRKNGQAVTLYFKSWPKRVDIVPAKRVSEGGAFSHFCIPDINRGIWIETNPGVHANSMKKLEEPDRQRIRMVKTWNKAHSEYLQSYHIEVMALSMSQIDEEVWEVDWPWEISQFFDEASKSIRASLYHPDEASGPVDDYLSPLDRQEATTRLDRARDLARDAWLHMYRSKNSEAAIRIYEQMFGTRFPSYG